MKDKTEAGMLDGVEHSAHFVPLVLSQCVFSRWFCQKEIERARETKKPIVIVRPLPGSSLCPVCMSVGIANFPPCVSLLSGWASYRMC